MTAQRPHPDPEWWLRCRNVRVKPRPMFDATDLCNYCGHIRSIHTDEGGCWARSTSMVGNPAPCACTNKAIGELFRDAGTLVSPSNPKGTV